MYSTEETVSLTLALRETVCMVKCSKSLQAAYMYNQVIIFMNTSLG